MSLDFTETNLEEIYDFSSGLSKSVEEFGFGFPFLSFKTIFNNYYIDFDLEDLVNSTDQEQKKHSVKRGDVFLTRTSETLDELAMSCVALKDYPNATFNGFTKRLRPKEDKLIYPLYAIYYFRSSLFRKYVDSMATMTTRASLNNNILSKLPIFYPSYDNQIKIGNILHNLSKKIELNKQLNNNLEEIIHFLYNKFFIKNNPYNNNSNKKWKYIKLNDLIIRNREKIKEFEDWKDELLIDLSNMPRFSISITNFDTGEKFKSNIYKLEKYDLLFGSIRPYFGKVGFSPINGVVTGTVHSFKPKKAYYFSLVLSLISSKDFINYTVSVSKGTKMPSVKWDDFVDYEIFIPEDLDYIRKFDNLVFPFIKKIDYNIHEIQKLKKLRDTLLPKLMSGEIDVSKVNCDLD